MRAIPDFFVRDLEIIDPTYFVKYNQLYNYFEIKKEMEVERKDKERGIRVRIKNPTVAVFRSLNEAALNNLRKRKYEGLKYARKHDSDEYLNDIIRSNKEAKKKKEQIALEMVAEGMIKIDNIENRRKVIFT
jgi:hypothetical protein